ncbi:AMP-binding protein [Cellvibrio fibrivorans]|uniref:Acyl-coenzyme A synthetase/AMP-(Fatty) acid ligase n=1 Tax=Cellvibrio fibrivorans TaxID=126350 RepID=A0ABU1UUD5_9GAMM|nr:AMP-binding protein [Cellvibrio fibrivorans]MDR7088799.1 acyl-coenzyme A synthetase/AMP-(fatty) acid ligase [Cellvibrio fibrivorans]
MLVSGSAFPDYPDLPALALNAQVALISPYVPQQTLVIHQGRAISQAEFLRDLQIVSAHLPDSLSNRGFALNLCEDRYYFLLGFCALLVKGAINLLPPNRQPLTLTELAQDYPGCYCLFDNDQACDLPSINLARLLIVPTPVADNPVLPMIPAQQIAAIAFTSGSTGKPQANTKCWGTFAATARMLGRRLGVGLTAPTIVGTVPPQHMYGLETTLLMVLQAGMVMHSDKPFYPADVQVLLQQLRAPVILVTTPIHLRALVNSDLPMPPLAGIISATAPLDPALALAAEQCFHTSLWEIYGCTEAGSMATRRSTQTIEWQLLDGFQLSQTDTGACATAPHLHVDAPIQDHLELHADGRFLLCGRNADMINVAGKRASLANLTLQLLRIEGVRDGVIFLPPQSSQAEARPVALVVSDLPEKTILAALALRVDATFLPRPLRKVATLPRNETGKLTVAALHQLWNQLYDRR